jgi:4-diphosphocytidyl-2-C-methyl-D-erythritol kinase
LATKGVWTKAMIRVFAPAKVNLTLEVGRPRADGMHPLSSVVAFADVGDWVSVETADALSLEVTGPFAEALRADSDNLVLRAARALAEKAGVKARARIDLEKHLPVASGLGGGSSDAAATLRALNELWRLGLSDGDLAAVGRPLGADVAMFFVAGGGALLSGIGDAVAPFEPPPLYGVLVNPLKPLPTPDVYRAFDRMGLGGDLTAWTPSWTEPADVWRDVAARGNDLAPAAAALMPELDEIVTLLRADTRAGCVLLSGSGATVFALAENWAAAQSLARDVSAQRPAWWTRPMKLGSARVGT